MITGRLYLCLFNETVCQSVGLVSSKLLTFHGNSSSCGSTHHHRLLLLRCSFLLPVISLTTVLLGASLDCFRLLSLDIQNAGRLAFTLSQVKRKAEEMSVCLCVCLSMCLA